MSLAEHPHILPSLQALLADGTKGSMDGFLDLLPVGVYLCDRDGRVVDYNQAAAELWGRAPQRGDAAVRFCGSYRMHSLDGDIIPHEQCPMAEVLATGEARRDEEIVIERYDGTRLTALVSIEPVKDAEGRVLGAVNVFRDNSAHHHERKHLRRQHRKLDTLLQALPAAVYTTDAEGCITFFNEAAAELWGVRPALGTDRYCGSWKLFRPDGTPLPHDECPMAQALKTRTPLAGVEAVAERPDGSRVPFLAYPTPLFDSAGALVGAVNMLLSMAERQEIDERLRNSEERYRAVFENAQVAFWEVDFSQALDLLDSLRNDGVTDLRAHLAAHPQCLQDLVGRLRVTGVNRFTRELFGAPEDKPLPDVLAAILLPETDAMLLEEMVALWEGRRRCEGETVLRTLSGRRLNVVVHITFDGERASRSIASVHDITARKASELAAQRLAAIVESSDDAILSKNIDGIITSWNKAAERLFGYTAEEAIGQPVTMLIPLDRRSEEDMILGEIRNGMRIQHYDTMRQRKDGSQLPISLTISPLRAADGTIIGASKIAREITDRVEAQEQQKLLLREMNHRIKNLLTLSSGLVSLSARYAATPGELASAVQERLNALAQAHEMILPGTYDAAGEADHSITLHALIKTIVAPYDDPAASAGSRIEVRGADTELSGRAVTSFALLLHEFATNAAKYGALSVAGGGVEIDCSQEGANVAIVWRERGGPGIDPESAASRTNGFGDVMARATVKSQLRGELVKEWDPQGLTIRLTVPKDRMLS